MTNKIIKKEIIVAASIKTAWWKWTTEEGIKTFFAKECKVELRRNGAYEMYFLLNNPIGLRGGEGCKVLSYLPEKMLSFSWNAPPDFPNVRAEGDVAWVVLNFLEIKENQTKVTLHHLGFKEGEEWNLVYEYFEKAWDKVMEWFKESF